jgi:hypothetical protein
MTYLDFQNLSMNFIYRNARTLRNNCKPIIYFISVGFILVNDITSFELCTAQGGGVIL